jgi:hypothetical protein
VALVLGFAGAGKAKPDIDPAADRILRGMTDFLARQTSMSVHVEGMTEVVGDDGQKLQIGHASDVRVRRPDKLRSDRTGEGGALRFYYDGETFTIYGARANAYATAPAPSTLERALDRAREQLHVEAPAADLVYEDAYEGLMADTVSGKYLGPVVEGGVRCHHLAFRGRDVDWQIWIEAGARPVPKKYVIVTKTMSSQPEFEARFSKWDFEPIADEVFEFVPPRDAERVEFMKREGTR